MQWNKVQADRCRKAQVSKIVMDNVIQYVIRFATSQRKISLTQIRLAVDSYMKSNQLNLEKEWVEWIVISLFNDFNAHRMVSLPDKLAEQHYGQYMTQQQSIHYDDFSDIPLGEDYFDSAQKNAAFAKKQKKEEEIARQFAPK